jgi:hypothetical protein
MIIVLMAAAVYRQQSAKASMPLNRCGVTLNSVLGIVQEGKAEKAIDALLTMSRRTQGFGAAANPAHCREEITVAMSSSLRRGTPLRPKRVCLKHHPCAFENPAHRGVNTTEKNSVVMASDTANAVPGDCENMIYMEPMLCMGGASALLPQPA